jgi:hypothetical protein
VNWTGCNRVIYDDFETLSDQMQSFPHFQFNQLCCLTRKNCLIFISVIKGGKKGEEESKKEESERERE